MADFGSVQHTVARQFQVSLCSLQALCQVCRQTAGWEMGKCLAGWEMSKLSTSDPPQSQWFHFAGWEMSELSTNVITHRVNDFILLAGKCQSYPQMWSPTVSMIWFCWLGNVRAIHKWSPTVSVVLFWQISISFLKLLFDFIWGECEMCYSPPFLKLLNLVAWGVFIQVFSASMSSWITETKNGKRAKRLGPPLAQMQFWAKRVSSWTLMSHQLHRFTSGWITRSKFFYTSSKYKR